MKCKKCGYENLSGGTKCGKCGTPFVIDRISCPKCATINEGNAQKCKKCGYKFNKKDNMLINILISLLLMAVLVAFVLLDKSSWVKNVNIGFKVLAVVVIILLIMGTLFFRRDDAIDKNIPELEAGKKKFQGLKIVSKISLTLVGLIVLGVGIYFAIKYLF